MILSRSLAARATDCASLNELASLNRVFVAKVPLMPTRQTGLQAVTRATATTSKQHQKSAEATGQEEEEEEQPKQHSATRSDQSFRPRERRWRQSGQFAEKQKPKIHENGVPSVARWPNTKSREEYAVRPGPRVCWSSVAM